jgi:hypothetical protein
MIAKLQELERQLYGYSESTKLNAQSLLVFPEYFRQIHSYKIFGNNLLAIPASLLIKGDDEEFESPFFFVDDIATLQIFESEYRTVVPEYFIQIGYLGGTEIVLLNKTKNSIHVFHVQDVADVKWLTYKLENEICLVDVFIESLRIQTVSCFINPKDYSQCAMFEIRNDVELKNDSTTIKYTYTTTVWSEYLKLVKRVLDKGFELHYAPKRLISELKG